MTDPRGGPIGQTITRPDLHAAARAEHAAALAVTPYMCPIPKDLLAPPAREASG